MVDPVEAAQPAARNRDLMRALREHTHSFKAKVWSLRGGGVRLGATHAAGSWVKGVSLLCGV